MIKNALIKIVIVVAVVYTLAFFIATNVVLFLAVRSILTGGDPQLTQLWMNLGAGMLGGLVAILLAVIALIKIKESQ